MPTEKKQRMVTQLSERLARSRLIVLTDYRGLNTKDLTTVRRALEKVGAGYHVVKNTLLLLALRQAGVAGLEPYLEGPTAMVFAYEDPVAAAQTLRGQVADFPTVQIKGGWLEGQVLPPAAVELLATLPPRPVLLGQVVGALQSPMAALVSALAGGRRQLLYVLQVRSEQRPAESAA